MKNVLITTVTTCRNRGVEALVHSIVDQVRARWPDCRIVVFSHEDRYDRWRLNPLGVPVLGRRKARLLINRLTRRAQGTTMTPLLWRAVEWMSPEYEVFRNADVVISTGGDVFASTYGQPVSDMAFLEACLGLGRPLVFLAQSIGPFKTERELQEFAAIARRAALVTVRETATLAYCLDEMQVPREKVYLVADPAFLLPLPDEDETRALRQFHGITEDAPSVALGVSAGICSFSGHDADKHLQAWVAVVRMLTEEMRLHVVLIPHVQLISPAADDRVLATDILRACGFPSNASIESSDLNASEYKAVVSGCELVVSERFHACIAGLSTGVASVAIGYSVKASGIMSDLYGEDPAGLGVLISIKDFLNQEKACATVRKARANRETLAAQLNGRLPEEKRKASKSFELLASLGQGGGSSAVPGLPETKGEA